MNMGNPKQSYNFLPFSLFLFIATEIRCQEKSKGGLRYEVILAEPNLTQVQIPKAVQQPNNSTKEKTLTTQEIAEKLKAAEERRLVSFALLIFVDR